MSKEDDRPLVGKKALTFCGAFTAVFFVYMLYVCQSHVPAQTLEMRLLFGAYGALCLSGGCFLALTLLCATFIDQRRRKQAAA